MPLHIHAEQTARHQLPEDGAPAVGVDVRADAMGRDPVVAEPSDALVVEPPEHVGQVSRAEHLARAIHAGERFLACLGRVPGCHWSKTVVAVAAAFGEGLAEVGEQRLPAAAGQLAVAEHGVQLADLQTLAHLAGARPLHHPAERDHLLQTVDHPRVGGLTVAPRPSRLLVVGLDTLREVQVGDEAHVRLVDAHAEGDGGDDHDTLVALEAVLIAAADIPAEARVVGERVDAGAAEPLGCFVDTAPRQAVDDAGVAAVTLLQEAQELLPGPVLRDDRVPDVGAVEAAHKLRGAAEAQAVHDFPPCGFVGGRGECDAGNVGKAFAQR